MGGGARAGVEPRWIKQAITHTHIFFFPQETKSEALANVGVPLCQILGSAPVDSRGYGSM